MLNGYLGRFLYVDHVMPCKIFSDQKVAVAGNGAMTTAGKGVGP